MQVYKFGGASIATPERMAAILPIIQEAKKPLILVVSAIGKTTNALEAIVNEAVSGHKENAHALALELENNHRNFAKTLLDGQALNDVNEQLNVFFTELQWAIDDADAARYDYSYDQIVCIGELLSTRIVAGMISHQSISAKWVDVRDVIRTDATFREGKVDENYSKKQAELIIKPLLDSNDVVVTQGFIGATSDNASITLSREGSDYTAALLAGFLLADGVTIWKDVEGLQNADPKQFPNTVKIESVTYHEVIEMAFYGAQVIHPKTIKPLQNHGIPMHVRSFLNTGAKGSLISSEANTLFYPPIIVLKTNQVLLQITTRDFSFITEDNISRIYSYFHALNIKVNLIQNAAISFVACLDFHCEKLEALIGQLESEFKVSRNEDLQLLTIRHYTPEVLAELTKNKYVLLEQKTRNTAQLLMK